MPPPPPPGFVAPVVGDIVRLSLDDEVEGRVERVSVLTGLCLVKLEQIGYDWFWPTELRVVKSSVPPQSNKRRKLKEGGKKYTRRRVKKSSKKKLGYKLRNTRKQK